MSNNKKELLDEEQLERINRTQMFAATRASLFSLRQGPKASRFAMFIAFAWAALHYGRKSAHVHSYSIAPDCHTNFTETKHVNSDSKDSVTDHAALVKSTKEEKFSVGCNDASRLFSDLDVKEFNVSERAKAWEANALVFTECADLGRENFFAGQSVPPILHRIWECSDIPSRYDAPVLSWSDNFPAKYVFLWTSKARETYISQALGAEKVKLYRRLLPGAYRADLFKYVVMYFIGGFYSDFDAFLVQNITEAFFRVGTSMAMDLSGPRLLPGAILVSSSKDPVFRCAMGEVFDHSARKLYFSHDRGDLDISGPGVLGECVKHMIGKDDIEFRDSVPELRDQGYHLFESSILPDGSHAIILEDGSSLIVLQRGGAGYEKSRTKACDPGEHYSELYRRRAVYAGDR